MRAPTPPWICKIAVRSDVWVFGRRRRDVRDCVRNVDGVAHKVMIQLTNRGEDGGCEEGNEHCNVGGHR